MKKQWVWDIETYKELFLACFKNIETNEIKIFEISKFKSDIKKFYQFLEQKNIELIGFNNVNFDYPVIHNTFLKRMRRWNSEEIYYEAQNVIDSEYSAIWDNEVKIPQIDLYRIKHYDNKARRTSLKWLEYAMRMDDIRDLPYPPDSSLTREMMDEIIDYCIHDVNATHMFYNKCSKDIELRKQLSEEYNLNLINANDPKIGSEIFLDLLSKEMSIDKKELKNKRTYRKEIKFEEIVLPYIKFDTPEMKDVLNGFKSYVAKDTKGDFKFTGKIGNILNDFGQGGIHGCTKPGVYQSTKDKVIIDIDVNKAAS